MDSGHVTEHLAHRRVQPLRAVKHNQERMVERENPRSPSSRSNAMMTRLCSLAVCTIPSIRFPVTDRVKFPTS